MFWSFHRVWLFGLLFIALTVTSCNDEDDCLDSSRSLQEFIDDNNLTDIREIDGEDDLRYRILEAGDSVRPSLSSTVTVNYVGYTTDNDIFDQTTGTPISFPLRGVIQGWQLLMPQIGQGGRIQMFIPEDFAYGPNQAGSICPNTDLVFEVELIEVN